MAKCTKCKKLKEIAAKLEKKKELALKQKSKEFADLQPSEDTVSSFKDEILK